MALSGSDDKTAVIWDLNSAQARHVLHTEDQVKAVSLSSDGRLALTGRNDGALQLWNVQSGAQIGEIKVKGPIVKTTFSSDASMVALLTPSWIYLARVAENGLTYERGTLIADPWKPLFTLLPGASKLRFAYPLGVNTVQVQDLDLYSNDLKAFSGEPDEVLEDWSRKLGLNVGELGQIAKRWQEELVPDETDQYKQSKRPAPH